MEQMLRVGGEVWVKLPYGEFVIDQSSDAVLLAGGTGISAFTAFVEALEPAPPRRVWLVYGAREPGLLLFRGMLLEQAHKVPNLQIVFFTEAANGGLANEMAALPGAPICVEGRIDLAQVWSRVEQPGSKIFYLSGPPIMLTTLSQQLLARGLPLEHIRTDAWE